MITDQTKALRIVERWIDIAQQNKLNEHKKAFWLARDILEGKLSISIARRDFCINFLMSCCESSERDTLITAIKEVTF